MSSFTARASVSACANRRGLRFHGSCTALTLSDAQWANRGCPAIGVERPQGVPEIIFALGQLLGPLLMAHLDRLGGHGVGEPRRLGAEACALGRNLKTAPR